MACAQYHTTRINNNSLHSLLLFPAPATLYHVIFLPLINAPINLFLRFLWVPVLIFSQPERRDVVVVVVFIILLLFNLFLLLILIIIILLFPLFLLFLLLLVLPVHVSAARIRVLAPCRHRTNTTNRFRWNDVVVFIILSLFYLFLLLLLLLLLLLVVLLYTVYQRHR